MTEEVKVIVEKVPNSDARVYHVKSRLSEKHIEMFDFPLEPYDAEGLDDIGPVARGIVNHLNTVDGVDGLCIKPYDLSVYKASAFDWEDVEADIFYAIETALGKSISVVNQ